MPKTWNDVANSKEYKSLSPEDQSLAREQYFSDVVAPKVSPDEIELAKKQFDTDTTTPKEPGLLERMRTNIKY
jgi:hypothetical protein